MDSADPEGSATSSVSRVFFSRYWRLDRRGVTDHAPACFRDPRGAYLHDTGFYFLHDCSDPRALNEVGFYLREGSIECIIMYIALYVIFNMFFDIIYAYNMLCFLGCCSTIR